jgi:hypothetical protein
MTNAAFCGACNHSCGPGGTCNAGTCTCATGYMLCNGSCVNVSGDRNNCGMCGHACGTTQACVSGMCVMAPLYHGWTSPIPGCDTSTWNAMAPTVDGGYYPYNTGDSNGCRAWKLAATICTTQPVMYSDIGDWTCPMSGGFTDPVFGTYCPSIGAQYICSGCPGACNASCIYNPLSLRSCTGAETAQQ